jgi:hypothetical protein
MIDAGEPQVLERPFSKGFEEVLSSHDGIDVSAGDALEQIEQFFV